MSKLFQEMSQQLDLCQIKDQYSLRKKLQQLLSTDKQQNLEKLQKQIQDSQEKVQIRSKLPLNLEYDANLPITARRQEILRLIEKEPVVIIAGETGSGKSTQLPKFCLELNQGTYGLIGHTQPRRLAARSVAKRLADELKTPLGHGVGYQVRFQDQSQTSTRIKVMTDGILLAQMQEDPFLRQYDTLIIDEAHERSLNIDFLLGCLKKILTKRQDLKLIVTSATIDLAKFSKHFDNAPVVEVSGRTFPVEVKYRPLSSEMNKEDKPTAQAIYQTLLEIENLERQKVSPLLGGVLVFLNGERDILETAHFLRKKDLRNAEIIPLYARLSLQEQNKIFKPSLGRKIVLSTNLAETSLTVPDIHYVIDPGTARISRYSVRSKVQLLPIEPISQASANQRKGRCGRTADGICFRLYEQSDFLSRPEFTDAEILRTNLASVILQMLKLGIKDISQFVFIDPPLNKAINDGFKLLQELKAINNNNRITAFGRKMAALPIDPKLACILLQSNDNKALNELLIITSALSIQDPREYPSDRLQASRTCHQAYEDKRSDFISLINLWNQYEQQRQDLSRRKQAQYCQKNFLSSLRMQEWRDMHRQLLLASQSLKLVRNTEPASYEAIHQSLLTGFLSNLGQSSLDEVKNYDGIRNRKFFIFPGSALYKKYPQWVVSAQLVETSKLYAKTNAVIESQWIESLASHLLKRSYSDPYWQQKKAQVTAYEQLSLYGLIIVSHRPVHYGPIDPKLSREIFIRKALVEGLLQSQATFLQQNKKRVEAIEELESKARRRDILVDEQPLYDFYEGLIPAQIHDGKSFHYWYKKLNSQQQEQLCIPQSYLMRHDAKAITEAQFPDRWRYANFNLKISYVFEPRHHNDGVNLYVPAVILQQLPDYYPEWLVPGLLEEKCIALMRTLPKALRRQFVPIPDYANKALSHLQVDNTPLYQALGLALSKITDTKIASDAWNLKAMDAYYFMNFNILGEKKELLAQGRDLMELKKKFKQTQQKPLQSLTNLTSKKTFTTWDFSDLNPLIEHRAGLEVKVYPTLVDLGDAIELIRKDNEQESLDTGQQGLARLFILNLPLEFKKLSKKLKQLDKITLLSHQRLRRNKLLDQLFLFTAKTCFLQKNSENPTTKQQFEQLCKENKDKIEQVGLDIEVLLINVMQDYHSLYKTLSGKISFDLAISLQDMKSQLDNLIYPDFLLSIDLSQLKNYPRYLKAIHLRLEKLGKNLNQDRVHCTQLTSLWQNCLVQMKKYKELGLATDQLNHYRWMLEEYRVSIFAQQLGTSAPVSLKRLKKIWETVCQVF